MSNREEPHDQAEIKRLKERENERRYRQRHRERLLEKGRKWREQNLEKAREQGRAFYWRNRERILAQLSASPRPKRKYTLTPEQKLAAREGVKRYQARHPERLRERQRHRIKNDPIYAMKRLLRSRVSTAVRSQYTKKAYKTMDLIGCSVPKLIEYLESRFPSGMTWQNYGTHGWHIDHIIPCAVFDLSIPSQQKRCFHYTNLRPAWAKDNVGRGSRIEGELPLVYHRRGKKASALTPQTGRESGIPAKS